MDYSPIYVFYTHLPPKKIYILFQCYMYVYFTSKKYKRFGFKNRNYHIKLHIRQSRKFHWNSSFIHGHERSHQVKDIHIMSHSENLKERGRGGTSMYKIFYTNKYIRNNKWYNIHKNHNIIYQKDYMLLYHQKWLIQFDSPNYSS